MVCVCGVDVSIVVSSSVMSSIDNMSCMWFDMVMLNVFVVDMVVISVVVVMMIVVCLLFVMVVMYVLLNIVVVGVLVGIVK